MRFMVLVKSNDEAEAGVLPDAKLLSEMGKYNEELTKAGMMLAGDGLQASSKGVRVRAAGSKITVVDGPFAEARELVGGYWIIQAKSKADAVEWHCRAPFHDGQVEIRELFEMTDFPQDPAEQADGWRANETAARQAPAPARLPGTKRFIVMLKSDRVTESGAMPSEKVLTEMGALMEELVKSGALLSGEGLKPTLRGARIQYSGSKRTVTDGPFTEAKELIAGFSLIQTKTRDEAVDFAKRWIDVHCKGVDVPTGEIEIRQLFAPEDFPT
jgi:hypothetical protein